MKPPLSTRKRGHGARTVTPLARVCGPSSLRGTHIPALDCSHSWATSRGSAGNAMGWEGNRKPRRVCGAGAGPYQGCGDPGVQAQQAHVALHAAVHHQPGLPSGLPHELPVDCGGRGTRGGRAGHRPARTLGPALPAPLPIHTPPTVRSVPGGCSCSLCTEPGRQGGPHRDAGAWVLQPDRKCAGKGEERRSRTRNSARAGLEAQRPNPKWCVVRGPRRGQTTQPLLPQTGQAPRPQPSKSKNERVNEERMRQLWGKKASLWRTPKT